MVRDRIDLQTLDLEELSGVVNIYPWYAGARVELCRRMAELGEESWDKSKYASQALYVPYRKRIYDIMRSRKPKKETAPAPSPKPAKQIYVIGGDYYSADQYAQARKSEDNMFADFMSNALKQSGEALQFEVEECKDFYTEELAKIYLDQGYPQKAIEIYSQLSLRFPEKSVYFASLIEKIEH